MSIDLTTADRDELIDYIRSTLGINPSQDSTDDELRAMALGPKGRKKASKPAASDMAVINIHKVGGPMGKQDVFVAVNDRTFLIKRGVDVEVPKSVLHVLQNAVEDVYEYDEEARDLVKREVQAYPFTVVQA